MRSKYAAAGLAGFLATASAHAAVLSNDAIFSTFVTNSPNYNSVTLHQPIASTQGGSPVAQEFYVAAPTTIANLTFELSDPTATTDGGSILVYLVANAASASPPLPTVSGINLTGATQLGSIADSSLLTTAGQVSLAVSANIPGNTTDWIALVGTSSNMGAVWYRTNDLIGLDAGTINSGDQSLNNTTAGNGGMYNAHIQSPGGTNFVSMSGNSFELEIDAPEPGTLALFGAGMAGLGFARRRRANRSAV
jgi:hypothetical protein